MADDAIMQELFVEEDVEARYFPTLTNAGICNPDRENTFDVPHFVRGENVDAQNSIAREAVDSKNVKLPLPKRSKGRPRRKPQAVWDRLKSVVCELYANKSLEEVREILHNDYNTQVT